MFILACVALALVVSLVAGGRPARLAALPWRHRWLLPLALAVQTVVVEVPGLSRGVAAVAHVLTYGVAALFLWLNRRVPGLWLLGLGAAANGVTIALNGGVLPADPGALRAAGIAERAGFVNSGPVAEPVLPWLGDVFAVPGWVPLANVFSVGDVLVVAGAAWLIHAGARRPAAHGDGAPPRPDHWWLQPDPGDAERPLVRT